MVPGARREGVQGAERHRFAAVLVGACAIAACSTDRPDDAATRDASADASAEVLTVKLTLHAFRGYEDRFEGGALDGGQGAPVPLAGVHVCIAYRAPYGSPWSDFIPIDVPARPHPCWAVRVVSEMGQTGSTRTVGKCRPSRVRSATSLV